jgi:hypothetical protein
VVSVEEVGTVEGKGGGGEEDKEKKGREKRRKIEGEEGKWSKRVQRKLK